MELNYNRKGLFIVNEFPPLMRQGGIRVLEIAKRLLKYNIEPIIITRKLLKNDIITYSALKEIPQKLKIVRTNYIGLNNKYLIHLFNPYFRFDYYTEWIPYAYLKAKKIIKKNPNIKFIFATGPKFSSFILGYLLKKRFNIHLIIDYRDPWSYYPYIKENEQILNKKLDFRLEKKIHRLADLITTVSPALNFFLKSKFPFLNRRKIYAIENGLNPIKKELPESPKNTDEIIFTFTGKLYGIRDITPLLKLISDLKKEGFFKDFRLVLKIFGGYMRSVKQNIHKLKIADIVFLGGQIPRSQVFRELAKSDLAVHIGENYNYPTLAFKIWDYLSMKKKILYLGRDDSYTANFLKKNNYGVIIPLNNLNKGKKVLKDLINKIRYNQFKTKIDEQEILKYTWDIRVDKFVKILEENLF
ncbi:MAG: glycosyltransferase [Promethearchaeota archaeon]